MSDSVLAPPSHQHRFDGAWPFPQSEHTLAFCCEHVFRHERPILRVFHDLEDWQFLCDGDHDDGPRVICLGCVLDLDGTLVAVADLPAGWSAERRQIGAPWSTQEEPDIE